jgi:putative membrane protein
MHSNKIQVAAYIILGLATIGSEIENPFGQDVNDLPLDTYCRQIAIEIDYMTATPRPNVDDFMSRADNLVLFPLSQSGYPDWKERSVEDIRGALRTKVIVGPSSAASDTSTIVENISTKTTGSSV